MFPLPFSLTLFFQAIWYIYINCYFCQLYGLSCLRPFPWRWFQLHKPWPGEWTTVVCFVSHLFLRLAALNTPYVQIHICLPAEIMGFCGQLLSSPPCFIMQIPPCLRRHTLANVLCCFIIYRGFTQLSIFRLSRHCTTLHFVCMPARWIMGNAVLWALCHSWGQVLPP